MQHIKTQLDYHNPILAEMGTDHAILVPLDGIISCLTGIALMDNALAEIPSKNNMDSIYKVLDAMTGQSLMTHALGRAMEEAMPYLEDQYLDALRFDLANMKHWLWDDKYVNHKMHHRQYMRGLIHKWGAYALLIPMPMDDYEVKDPVQELLDMGVSPDQIITIDDITEDNISPYGDLP